MVQLLGPKFVFGRQYLLYKKNLWQLYYSSVQKANFLIVLFYTF